MNVCSLQAFSRNYLGEKAQRNQIKNHYLVLVFDIFSVNIRRLHVNRTLLLSEKSTWGSLEVNPLWCCKPPFPQGQDNVCPHPLGSASWSVTAGGNPETGPWNGRSWSKGSTMTNEMPGSLWASHKPGRSGESRPCHTGCKLRRKTHSWHINETLSDNIRAQYST